MKTAPFVVDVRPVRSENISVKEYLRLIESSPGLIEKAQFVAPIQGKKGFGMFSVKYSRARHRALEHG
jgi:hypothetical protein